MTYGSFFDQRKMWRRDEAIDFMNKFSEVMAEKKHLQNPMEGETSQTLFTKKSK